MRAGELFQVLFRIDNIKEVYFERVRSKSSPGLDRINRKHFEKNLEENINIIHKKVLNNSYEFTNYKQKLISKGAGKNPRVISIPTIRDKITLAIIKDILARTFGNEVSYSVIHKLIKDIVYSVKNSDFDYYLKIDLSQFYDSINHDLLIKRLRIKVRRTELINLIIKAIKTPTVEENYSRSKKLLNDKGVPQGLSISNVLASLFLSRFDLKHRTKSHYKYYRFVDDILILCYEKDYKRIKTAIENELEQKYLLRINREKEESGKIDGNNISYLGYLISKDNISVRQVSIRKLELALENLFKEYAVYKKYTKNLFVWKLNIKITGLIKDNNKMGWAFFFSQITDESVLFHLDWLIQKYIKRFKLDDDLQDVKIKKYVRTLKEINNNLHGTTYIPNLDKYSIDDKRIFIQNILGINVGKFNDVDINEIFEKESYKFIRELERDLQHFS